ncbi:UDP-N-acetylenolpyruvoylglucosamine reductase [Alphaproteobacteria bacterium]|nr:UDP-N-acetylenolpyruvoylglucosamine reductase [Alphaproteobacteria bacterium]
MISIDTLPKVKGVYRQNARISNWFNVGGNAEILYRPSDAEDLQFFLREIDKKIPIQILGLASNVIISDDGVRGVLIRLGSEFSKINHYIVDNKIIIRCGASALCINVANYARQLGYSGLEFLSGIPGSVGGAIAMNAGCYGSEVSQVLLQAQGIDYNGEKKFLANENFNFSYRYNSLNKKYFFIEGDFVVERSSYDQVSKTMNELQIKREESQPIRAKTGGSTFKNPPPPAKKAWELIDEIGYRGKKIGDAQFSTKHCNFLINAGNASAKDLIELADSACHEIEKKFSIILEWEIKIIK